MLFDIAPPAAGDAAAELSADHKEALKDIAVQLVELRDMLRKGAQAA